MSRDCNVPSLLNSYQDSIMDLYSSSIITTMYSSTTFTLLACLLTFLLLALQWSKKKPSGSPPEPKGALPILGHLRIFSGPEPPHRALSKLADEYGPVFKIRLGVRQVLVVSNSEMARECFLVNDKDFISIPNMVALELLLYNGASVATAPSGPYWRELRKISTQELLSNHRLAALEHVWVPEARAAVKGAYHKCVGSSGTAAVEMGTWFGNLALNSILRLVCGKSFPETEDAGGVLRILREYFHLSGVLTMGDVLPYMRWFDIEGYEKRMKKTAKEFDLIAQEWLDTHRKNRVANGGEKCKDFMDILMNIFDSGDANMFGYDADTIIKATCVTMVLGAADTLSVTITWTLCLLLNHPESLKKVKEELKTHVGNERKLEESDIPNLTYLQAVIYETMRLYPAAPLLIPRESTADTIVGGYHIPVGTWLFVNAHKIQRDPLLWDDPCVFRPERFLTTHKHIDPKGLNYGLIPFSSGRRICSGISYAMQAMPFFLGSLFHSFDITPVLSGPVDMGEKQGLTVSKATPLDVVLTPRLPQHLYA